MRLELESRHYQRMISKKVSPKEVEDKWRASMLPIRQTSQAERRVALAAWPLKIQLDEREEFSEQDLCWELVLLASRVFQRRAIFLEFSALSRVKHEASWESKTRTKMSRIIFL